MVLRTTFSMQFGGDVDSRVLSRAQNCCELGKTHSEALREREG